MTFAPDFCNKAASHEPLKPVCPVMRTVLFWYEFENAEQIMLFFSKNKDNYFGEINICKLQS